MRKGRTDAEEARTMKNSWAVTVGLPVSKSAAWSAFSRFTRFAASTSGVERRIATGFCIRPET